MIIQCIRCYPDTQPKRTCIEAAGLTDRGRLRSTNEDRYCVARELGFFALADGVVSGEAGLVAAKFVLDSVRGTLEVLRLNQEGWGEPAPDVLDAALQRANLELLELSRSDPRRGRLGTTFVGLLMVGSQAVIAHVGDSRAYRLRRGVLSQLTTDHTLGAGLLAAGLFTLEDAARSPYGDVLVQYVGCKEWVAVGTQVDVAEAEDVYLLASDGLHTVVPRGNIAEILTQEADLERAATALVARANASGGPDNIAVVLVRVR